MRIAALLIALGMTACTRVNTYGASASAGHPPPLPAGAVVPMWEHFCGMPMGRPDSLITLLDEASANGWELVSQSMDHSALVLCFKRPRGAPAEPPGKSPPMPPTPPSA